MWSPVGGLDEMSHEVVGVPVSDTAPRWSVGQIHQMCLALGRRGVEVLQMQEMG